METEATIPQQTAAALVYWQKGPRYIPAIMSLESDNTLSLTSADQAQLFRAPLSEISIRFSAWGTLRVEVKGAKYAIRSSGGLVASSIPRWQAEAVRGISQAGHFVGNMRKWQEVFIRAGVPLKPRRMRAMTIYIVTLIAVVIGAALLAKYR